jgi:hypothetical protein
MHGIPGLPIPEAPNYDTSNFLRRLPSGDDRVYGRVQRWRAVTRPGGVPFYNDTGRPIKLCCTGVQTTNSGSATITFSDGTFVYLGIQSPGGAPALYYWDTNTVEIPDGETYTLTFSNWGSVSIWELR